MNSKYRPVPFWSWNEKLDINETKRQIHLMNNSGIGGFIMHARGGLQTEYFSEDWFSNISAGVSEGLKLNMHPWVYDENGWPSGFGNGKVTDIGDEFQQKYLCYEPCEQETAFTICNYGGYHFYYEVNPFYVDVLCKEATLTFINEIYEPYYEKYKNNIEGFFTDEPQMSRNRIPWSNCIPYEYKKAYGEDIFSHLIELFKSVGDYKKTRLNFWRLVTRLFSENFFKPIFEWCDKRKLKLTGHLVEEENLEGQLTANGAVMPHYEYFHIPGMDWLGRSIYNCLTPFQVTSVAHQLGKKQVISETFALCGHNVGFDELKGIYEWQMVKGVNLLCQHLQGYSLRGIRKRDYPPAMYYQQPWWNDYKIFNDTVSRIGMLLTEGEIKYDTLLIHPQSSAWVCFDNDKNEGLKKLNQDFLDTIDTLNQKHILFHLGDETIMERHAKVEGNTLVIGCQRYKTVVLPPYKVLFDSTKKLLDEFKNNGGKIITADAAIENNIISSPFISYTKRVFNSYDLYYFVNSTNNEHFAKISVGNKIMNINTGELSEFCGKHCFKPYESIVVIDDSGERRVRVLKKSKNTLDLTGEWVINNATPNSITLDKCNYYFDGELVEKNGYVLDIMPKACKLKRPVEILCEYKLNVKACPKSVFLVCETPEIFDIKINNKTVDKTECGYFSDISFRKIDISKYLTEGTNTITLSVLFKQSKKVYDDLENVKIFESQLNKFTYDMEIEPIYVIGDFSVKCYGKFEKLNKSAVRYNDEFTIDKPVKNIKLSNIEQQGFPFFCGSITVEKSFDLADDNYDICFNKKGVNVVKIKVNGIEADTLMWEPFCSDISNLLVKGENKIELTLINNLRNMLGPHHLEEGECHFVGASSFFKGESMWLWKGAKPPEWNDGYCFAEFGIF